MDWRTLEARHGRQGVAAGRVFGTSHERGQSAHIFSARLLTFLRTLLALPPLPPSSSIVVCGKLTASRHSQLAPTDLKLNASEDFIVPSLAELGLGWAPIMVNAKKALEWRDATPHEPGWGKTHKTRKTHNPPHASAVQPRSQPA